MIGSRMRRRSGAHHAGGGGGGGGGSGDPLAYLEWDASAITGISDGASLPYTSVLDQSGNGRHATAMNTSTSGPSYAANGLGTGKPTMYFPSDSMFRFPDLTGLTEADIFVVVKRDNDPVELSDNTFGPILRLGTSGSHMLFPANDGNWYDDAGSSTMHTVGNPSPSLATARLYNVISTPTEWTARLDTTQLYTTATNTVAFPAGILCSLGGVIDGGSFHAGAHVHIAHCRIYPSKRTSGERTTIEAAMRTKWGLTGY